MAAFRFSGGNLPDAVERAIVTGEYRKQEHTVNLLMDRTSEDNRTRAIAGELGLNPVVPLKRSRVYRWEYGIERTESGVRLLVCKQQDK
ncbi:MAG: hypothetical protein LBB43_06620 [Spirochaetaceae bacterium]|jgi:hypothetical protein|nr:hypothetical protein [Spirochaetaceae bacterium]